MYDAQEDHLGVPLQFRIPAEDSLTQIQLRPWIFVWNFLLYLFFGQGLLISPVVELSIFLQSRLLDSKFSIVTPSKDDTDAALPQNRPDIELMPVSTVSLLGLCYSRIRPSMIICSWPTDRMGRYYSSQRLRFRFPRRHAPPHVGWNSAASI